jgi:ABC-type sugar transport system permease subunit
MARCTFCGHYIAGGLANHLAFLYEASAIDGATPWQQFWHVTLPLLTPIIAVTMTFSVLFTFTDFQLIYVLTRGGPSECHAPHGHAVFPTRHSWRRTG